MEVIIDIPEEIYQEAITSGYSYQYDEVVANAVAAGTPLDDVKVEIEQKAYLDGFEGCAECVEKYLSDENKKRLECLLSALRNSVSVDWGEESEE